jgi:hypothetical protein
MRINSELINTADNKVSNSFPCGKVASSAEIYEVLAELLERKVRVEVFSNWQSIVHHKFIPEGAVVKERYIESPPFLQEAIHVKHPELWVAKE